MKINWMPVLAGVITISAMATPFAVKAQAQTPSQTTPTQRTYQHHGRWDKLNLSDQQKAQMRQIQSDTRAQIEAVLTPQQREQLNAARQNKQGNQANQANQTRQGRHHFMAALNLTDAQKSRIRAIKQSQKTRMLAILTPAQRQQFQQMQQQRQQMRQQRQQQNSQ